MAGPASDLPRALARNAEAVCRHYLGAGRREGRYWIAGDALGSPGRSLYVRLKGDDHGKGAAGKWTDAATGEHGDLLDLIGLNCGHRVLAETIEEARTFLSLPRAMPNFDPAESRPPAGSRKAARRLFAAFKRNDVVLATLPVGIILFPGGGIQENLFDKARKMGIPVWRFE